MKLKLVVALIAGSIGYVLTTLYSLISRYPLRLVLVRGLIVFALLFLTGWFSVLGLQLLAARGKDKKEEEEKERDEKEQQAGQEREEPEEGEKFTPLNPPHLEVEEEENRQGGE